MKPGAVKPSSSAVPPASSQPAAGTSQPGPAAPPAAGPLSPRSGFSGMMSLAPRARALKKAVAGHSPAAVQAAAARVSDVDVRFNPSGKTALHEAAAHSTPGVVQALVDAKADVEKPRGGPIGDKRGNRALHEAARTGNHAVVPVLLQAGADPEGRNSSGKRPVDLVPRPATLTSANLAAWRTRSLLPNAGDGLKDWNEEVFKGVRMRLKGVDVGTPDGRARIVEMEQSLLDRGFKSMVHYLSDDTRQPTPAGQGLYREPVSLPDVPLDVLMQILRVEPELTNTRSLELTSRAMADALKRPAATVHKCGGSQPATRNNLRLMMERIAQFEGLSSDERAAAFVEAGKFIGKFPRGERLVAAQDYLAHLARLAGIADADGAGAAAGPASAAAADRASLHVREAANRALPQALGAVANHDYGVPAVQIFETLMGPPMVPNASRTGAAPAFAPAFTVATLPQDARAPALGSLGASLWRVPLGSWSLVIQESMATAGALAQAARNPGDGITDARTEQRRLAAVEDAVASIADGMAGPRQPDGRWAHETVRMPDGTPSEVVPAEIRSMLASVEALPGSLQRQAWAGIGRCVPLCNFADGVEGAGAGGNAARAYLRGTASFGDDRLTADTLSSLVQGARGGALLGVLIGDRRSRLDDGSGTIASLPRELAVPLLQEVGARLGLERPGSRSAMRDNRAFARFAAAVQALAPGDAALGRMRANVWR